MHASPVQQVCCQKCGLILWSLCVTNFTNPPLFGNQAYFCKIFALSHICYTFASILVAESILYFSTVFSDTLSVRIYSIYKTRDRLGTSQGPQSEGCCWKFGEITARGWPSRVELAPAPLVTETNIEGFRKTKLKLSRDSPRMWQAVFQRQIYDEG